MTDPVVKLIMKPDEGVNVVFDGTVIFSADNLKEIHWPHIFGLLGWTIVVKDECPECHGLGGEWVGHADEHEDAWDECSKCKGAGYI